MAEVVAKDFPFDEAVAGARRRMRQGATVFQKFTCAGCGGRLTIEFPNQFFELGTCDKCNVVTNIRQRGCNYMLVLGGQIGDILRRDGTRRP